MCGPTSGQKSAANQISQFASTATSQAGEIFGNASTVFNNLMSSFQQTVKAGPDQQGFSQDELNNLNSNVITSEAEAYKNAKSAVGNAVSAVGGGNSVNPSGLAADVNASTANAAAEATATGEQNVVAQDYATGRQNYDFAAQGEAQLPGVFSTSNQASQVASGAQENNMTAQNNIASADNWWQPIVAGAVGGLASGFTGGLGGNLGKSTSNAITGNNPAAPSSS